MNKWIKVFAGAIMAALLLTTMASVAFARNQPGGSVTPMVDPTPLSADEADGLIFMREEEKLARDVYLTLYEQWGLSVFNNIAGSEQTHMDTIKGLLDRFGLVDPAADQGIGEFTNSTLQALYNDLVAQGSQSLSAALSVGAAIEEIDILDLQERLATTTHADIELVYTNLMRGSENHLRAFVTTLAQQGADYAPQYMDQAAFDTIMAGSSGYGAGGARGGRQTTERGFGQRGQGRG